jgi:dethiobiotin synthetase
VSGLLVAGTTSDAGKSVVTAGVCRWLARQGVKVAPFKAQNMSLNSMVTGDGAEIGRAQYMQAQAARVEPRAVMNPVLLKPGSDRRSQVVVLGRPVAEVDALQYGAHKEWLKGVVLESLEELRSEFDVVVCEGAGSPAEINLRAGDIVNMGLARAAGLPVVVVGDIDRGGVFASLYGTVALLDEEDQALIAGFVINKFRGAYELLKPGLEQLEALTGRPTLGVLPWKLGLYLDSEDTLALDAPRPEAQGPHGKETLRIAVVRFPRISNFTDLDALACEPGVIVRYAASAGDLAEPRKAGPCSVSAADTRCSPKRSWTTSSPRRGRCRGSVSCRRESNSGKRRYSGGPQARLMARMSSPMKSTMASSRRRAGRSWTVAGKAPSGGRHGTAPWRTTGSEEPSSRTWPSTLEETSPRRPTRRSKSCEKRPWTRSATS